MKPTLHLLTALILAALNAAEPATKAASTGELRDWYSLATFAFVGKSPTAHGGQNSVEPALADKAVVFGPHMENFESVVRLLLQAEGAVQVDGPAALEAQVTELLGAPERRQTLGQNAIRSLSTHQGATRRTVAAILNSDNYAAGAQRMH
jgi:3-deoxy-D-manno-octulosonic-acid transferase